MYTLYSYCNGNHLASDKVGSGGELIKTFKEAFGYYTGKTVDDDILFAFLVEKEVIVDDGDCEYSFCY